MSLLEFKILNIYILFDTPICHVKNPAARTQHEDTALFSSTIKGSTTLFLLFFFFPAAVEFIPINKNNLAYAGILLLSLSFTEKEQGHYIENLGF